MTEIEKAISEIIGTNYGECQCHRETMVQAVEALREYAERQDPKPLTEDQIRGMVGKPVWIHYLSTGHIECAIVKSENDGKVQFTDGMFLWLDGLTELYAHEPKKD
mgnify:CR=1 FL=1